MGKKVKNQFATDPNEVSTRKNIVSVSALNAGQKNVLRAIATEENSIVLISGTAGTGKTYCAVSWGVQQFLKGKYAKLVFSRPTVEAGESLGYLPGDFDMKIAPYMMPIFDVLEEYLPLAEIKRLVEDKKIQTFPLAYMRGSTFKNSFVLLDEAQNTTAKQMHLFLTRIGKGSKLVITGDPKQSDLGENNGFVDALDNLDGIKGLEIVELEASSIVRHEIIASIDERYGPRSFMPGKRS
jgi:phosphate starvation-inducible protein PhoH and related proteins